MKKSGEPTARSEQALERDRLIVGIVVALVVTGIAVAAYDDGPRWSEALRWFTAGIAVASMLTNIAAFRLARRSRRRQERIYQEEIAQTARQFADALEREMAKRGHAGRVDIETGPPPTTRMH